MITFLSKFLREREKKMGTERGCDIDMKKYLRTEV